MRVDEVFGFWRIRVNLKMIKYVICYDQILTVHLYFNIIDN